jgi:hypothetical protein
MSEIEALRQRVLSARRGLHDLPLAGRGSPGPPDDQTGERWDRGNVLGHTAEMLPFWCEQVRAICAGATELSRGEAGYARRRLGIEGWAERDETALRAEIDRAIEDLLRLLEELTPADLERRALYRSATGESEIAVLFPLEQLLVGHLESHVRQLAELTGPAGQARGSG